MPLRLGDEDDLDEMDDEDDDILQGVEEHDKKIQNDHVKGSKGEGHENSKKSGEFKMLLDKYGIASW